jgi:hypothetical protein
MSKILTRAAGANWVFPTRDNTSGLVNPKSQFCRDCSRSDPRVYWACGWCACAASIHRDARKQLYFPFRLNTCQPVCWAATATRQQISCSCPLARLITAVHTPPWCRRCDALRRKRHRVFHNKTSAVFLVRAPRVPGTGTGTASTSYLQVYVRVDHGS